MRVKTQLLLAAATCALCAPAGAALAQQATQGSDAPTSTAQNPKASVTAEDPTAASRADKEVDKPVETRQSANAVPVQEVVVTAQKTTKNLDAQPVSVTTFNAEQRNLISAVTIGDMVNLTPGVVLDATYGFQIRGVGRASATTEHGTENGVAEYVDGFYEFEPGNVGESTLFAGTVQFLRGPQGTAFGRNAIAGVALETTRHPTKTFQGEGVLGYGSYGVYNVGGTYSGPITDRIGFRATAQYFRTDTPLQKNIGLVEAGYQGNSLYVEFGLEGNPIDDLHFRLRSTHFEYNSSPYYTAPALYNPNVAAQGALVPNPTYHYSVISPTQPFTINVNTRGTDKLTDNQAHILNVDYKMGPITLYYVGGFIGYNAHGNSDYDGTSRISYTAGVGDGVGAPYAAGTIVSTNQVANYQQYNQYFTHEFRIQGNQTKPLDWVLGVYYLNQRYNEDYWQSLPDVAALEKPLKGVGPALAAPNPRREFYEQLEIIRNSSLGMFGQATWSFNDQLSATAGLRYTTDYRHADSTVPYIFYSPSNTAPFVGDFSPTLPTAVLNRNDAGWTARTALEWEPIKNSHYYVSYAHGYKAGSFTLGDPSNQGTSKPEDVDVYELGAKTDIGKQISIDADVFYEDYKNFQVPVTAVNAATGGTLYQYSNIAQSRIYGVETEATWKPTRSFYVTANFSYLNGEAQSHDKFIDITVPVATGQVASVVQLKDISGNQLPRIPHYKASVAAAYTLDFAFGSLIFGGSVAYQSSRYETVFQNPLYLVGDRTLLNAAITYRTPDNRYELSVSGTNILDEKYQTTVSVAGPALGYVRTYSLGDPQRITANLRFRF